MKKILFITNDFGPRAGGIESFIQGLIIGLPTNSVIVYTSAQADSENFDIGWLDNHGVRIIRDQAKVLLPTIRVKKVVNGLIRDNEIEIIIFGAAAPLGLLAKSARKSGAKNIIAISHGHEVWWSKIWPFKRALKFIGENVDYLTYLGEFTRRAIEPSLSQASKSKMVRLAPGIDIEHFRPIDSTELKASLGLKGKRIIVTVGRLVHRKGQDVLIEALPAILESIPDAHLIIMGEGPYRKKLENLALTNGVSQSITFLGRVQYQDLPLHVNLGDVFVAPSRSRFAGLEVEGLGIVYLEASACAVPVIVGNSGGAPDALIDGVTGLCVAGTSSSEVSEATIKILKNSKMAKEMGESGMKWIHEEWQWKIWRARLNELLTKDQAI